MNNNALMENYNYHMDSRTWGKIDRFCTYDKKTMKARIHIDEYENENGDIENIDHLLPCKFAICDECDGHGKHVNPSIDAGGLAQWDMSDWDDYDREMYFGGGYDITCTECEGSGKVIAIQYEGLNGRDLEVYKIYKKILQDAWDSAREWAYERAMGAQHLIFEGAEKCP